MRENDFFAWRRDMLYRFQSATVAEDVYNLLQQQIQWLEYDFFSLC
ncbi:MAG: transcriptional regulator SdiA, partial [Enterobacteriaceae bacterium]|nr:transcriptional regulator SdiA [Enterobacteriaceae bacterium]